MLGSVASSLESELGVLKTLVSSLLDGLERNIGEWNPTTFRRFVFHMPICTSTIEEVDVAAQLLKAACTMMMWQREKN